MNIYIYENYSENFNIKSMILMTYNTNTVQTKQNNTTTQKLVPKSQVSITQVNVKLPIKLKVSNNKNLSKPHKFLTFTLVMKKITYNLYNITSTPSFSDLHLVFI